MNTQMKENSIDKKLDFLSGYQMLGGIIGIVFIVFAVFKTEDLNFGNISILALGILFYTFSFIAGLFLYQRKTNGIKLSLLNQLFQVIGFSYLGYGFEYVAGLSIDVFLKNIEGLDISVFFGLSNWHILINNDTGIQEISFNLVAIFLLIYTLTLRKEYTLSNSENQISNIGT